MIKARKEKPTMTRKVGEEGLRELIATTEQRIREWLSKDKDYPADFDEFRAFIVRGIKHAPPDPKDISPRQAEELDILHLINHLSQAKNWLDAGQPEAAAIPMYYAGVVSGGLRDNRRHEVFGQQAMVRQAERGKRSADARRDRTVPLKKKARQLVSSYLAKYPGKIEAAYSHASRQLRPRRSARTIRRYVTGS